MHKRVVITGIGGICGLGTNAPAIWNEMRAGRSAIGQIDNPLLHDLKVKVGCEIKAMPDHGIGHKQTVSMDRFSLLAAIAAREAMQQAGLTSDEATTYRMGTVVGVGVCGWEAIEENYRAILIDGKNRAGIFTVPKVMPSAAAGQVSMVLGLRGPVFGVTSACVGRSSALRRPARRPIMPSPRRRTRSGSAAPMSWSPAAPMRRCCGAS